MALPIRILSDPRDLELKRRQAEALEAIAKALEEIATTLRPTREASSIRWTVGTPTNEE